MRPRRLTFGLIWVVWVVASCSLLVEEDLRQVRCTEDGRIGPPACDPGEVCGAGRCQLCIAHEICDDEVDNDCNGRTDEGCGQSAGGRGMGGGMSSGGADDERGGTSG